MKGLLVLLSVVIHCDNGTPSCKDAIDKAFKTVGLEGATETLAIGTCEQKQWPQDARLCVANATGDAALEACGAKHGIELPSSVEATFAKTSGFRDQLCACADAVCVGLVNDEMTKWGAEQRTRGEPIMTDAQQKRATQLGVEIARCVKRAISMPSGQGKMPF